MFKRGCWSPIFGFALTTVLLLSSITALEALGDPALDPVAYQAWGFDGCIDNEGAVHIVHSTLEGLMFADMIGNGFVDPRSISTEDAQEAFMVFTGDDVFLVAYIMELDFFDTALRTIRYDGTVVLDTWTVLEGASYHNPTMTYFGGALYMAFEQGGSADGSEGFSSDIAVITSMDNGRTWTAPEVLFESQKDEKDPSLAVYDGKLYLSFVQTQEVETSHQGNAWEAEDNAVLISSFKSATGWSAPYRVSYDIAEVANPAIVPYRDQLAVVWATNMGTNGIENVQSISCTLYDGFIWTDPIIFRTEQMTDLVPLLIAYTNNLMDEGKTVPPYLTEFSGLEITDRDPVLTISTQEWRISSDTTEEVFRRNVTLGNSGNSLLEGTIEVPKGTDNIVVTSSLYSFDLDPDETMVITLQVELDYPGEYSSTVLFKTNDADQRVVPFFIDVIVEGQIDDFFPDFDELEVLETGPLGTSVFTIAPLTVTFSLPVDIETFPSALSITPEVSGTTFDWSTDGRSVTIGHAELEFNTTYTVTLGTNLLSVEGNALRKPFSWAFTTVPEGMWLLYEAHVTVQTDLSVNVSIIGLPNLTVYMVIDAVGSFLVPENEDGAYSLVIPSSWFAWNTTYSYHLSNISGGPDLLPALSGTFTTVLGPTPDDDDEDDDDEEDDDDGDGKGISRYVVLGMVIVLILLALIVVIFLMVRMASKKEDELNAEMALFFALLLLVVAFAPLSGSGQDGADTTYLMEEDISDISKGWTNITDPFVVVPGVSLMTRAQPIPPEMSSEFTIVTQVFEVGGRVLDGVSFHAASPDQGAAPLDVMVKDIGSNLVLGRSRIYIEGEMKQYLIGLNNRERIGSILVEFSTRGSISTNTPHRFVLGVVTGAGANASEVSVFEQSSRTATGEEMGRIVLTEMYNSKTLALGARYLDPKVIVMRLGLDKKALLLDREGDHITGELVIMNDLDHEIPVQVRVVCYRSGGREFGVANQFVDVKGKNLSDTLVFNVSSDLGLTEGKYVIVIGLYYQGSLIYRFGDDPSEMYSTAFLVSYRRIKEAEVLPTDRIRPGGHINIGILKVDGIGREVDDTGVQQLLEKVRGVAMEYAMSYDVREMTDLSELVELMEDESEDYALINTHGSLLPLPAEYVSEFTGDKDTVLLLHFNEFKEKPMDSSAVGNLIENFPKSRKQNNAFWIQKEGPEGSDQGKYLPFFVNGLAELPARPPSGKSDYMVAGLELTMEMKVMDLPKEGTYAQIATFWNVTDLEDAFWSMRLWNSRSVEGTVEIEISLEDGSSWESCYFEMPYDKGFNIGEWMTLVCKVDRTDPVGTVELELIDRFGTTFEGLSASLDVAPELDSREMDRLLIANDDDNGSLSWKPQPFEGMVSSMEYYLKDEFDGTLDSDTWYFATTNPASELTSYYLRKGHIYGTVYSDEDVFGPQFGKSFTFKGEEWLEVIDNGKQKLSELTIELLMRMDSNPGEDETWTLVSKGYRDNDTGFSLKVKGTKFSGNFLSFEIGTGKKTLRIEHGSPTTAAIELGIWHKICAVFDGAQMALQIDGMEVADLPVVANIAYDNSPIYLGGYGPTENYVGLLDEVIISKGSDNTNRNIKYDEWLGKISVWISSSHSVWVNPTGYPMGYLGMEDMPPIFYGDTLFKQLLAPLTHTPGDFLISGDDATRTPQALVLDKEFASLSLPERFQYDLACSASREGAVIPIYYDLVKNSIPSGAVKFGEGAFAFSTYFSPDITTALSIIRLPNDYLLNILNGEHYKGEDIIVRSVITNPSDDIETYFVNLTVNDPFGREYLAHSKNVTVLPGRDAEVHLLFQPKKSTYPKGTYRMALSVQRESDGMTLDIWGDDDDESGELMVNLIDDIEVEILDHPKEISHNGTFKVPVRVVNHGALPSYVNVELSILSPSGGVFDVSLDDRVMVASHKSKVVELEWDPAKAVEEQSRDNLIVDLPFGEYKVLVAIYDAESVLYKGNIVNQRAKETEKRVFLADDMEHLEGAKREAAGWSIEPQRPPVPGYLCKSMNSTDMEEGDYIAQFNLMINDNTGADEQVANISVWFGDTVVAYRQVNRNDFINPNSYQFFDVDFSTYGRRHQAISFRTYWEANCYLMQDRVEVVPYRSVERVENIEMRTKPIDFEYTGFSILAETQITTFLMKEGDHYVSAELFYEVGDKKGSFDIPKTDQCYSFTLYHYPKDTIFLSTRGLGGGKDLRISTVRTTETFIIQKKGSKLIDVEHGYAGDVVDITLTESTSELKIKDTLTLEDLSVNNYTSGVTAGFDDENSRPYVQFNSSVDWAEFEVDIPASKVQRLTIEAFEEVGKPIVLKCMINTSKAQLEVTFSFIRGTGTWMQNSTNVALASGHYYLRISQQRDGYHARMYPEIFVTPLTVFDHGETGNPKVEEAGNSISVCILGLGFNIDLSFIPKIPNIPIPGIEIPKLSIGETAEIKVVDTNRSEVETLEVGTSYYLRVKVQYEHEMKGSSKKINETHKSGLKYSWKKVSDKPGIESLTFIVGVELGFVYKEDNSSGFRYPDIDSFGLYELGVKIKIRLKAWSNPGTFILDICTGGSGSLTPGVSELFNVIFKGLKAIGFDIGAGLYLMIEAILTFKPYFKLEFNIYPLGELWAKIVINIWFFKFTILDLKISLVLPIGITVVADSGFSPWTVYIQFWIKLGGKLVLFMIKIFEGDIRINLFTIYISQGTPRSRGLLLPSG